MKLNNKKIRNFTIGAVTGGLIAGGITLAIGATLEDKQTPFKIDQHKAYKVTTEKLLSTNNSDEITTLKEPDEYLTKSELESTDVLEFHKYNLWDYNDDLNGKYYTNDVESYDFSYDSITDGEINQKIELFEVGDYLSVISSHDSYAPYREEVKEVLSEYEDIKAELVIKTIDYDDVIMVDESKFENAGYTFSWSVLTLTSIISGGTIGDAISKHKERKLKQK